jgi:Tol biopolymer transport system component
MSARYELVTDARIEQMLRGRSRGPDAGLLGEVLRLVDATPQPDRRVWMSGRLPGRTLALAALLVLLGALAGAAIIGGLNKRPAPPSVMPQYHHNGSILVLDGGVPRQIVKIGGEQTAVRAEIPYVGNVGRISWSPDGMQVAYSHPDAVWVLDVGTGEQRNLFECPLHNDRCIGAWSPLGTEIAVANGGTIFVITPDGASRSRFSPGVGTIYALSWAPDGSQLAFSTDGFTDFGSSTLFVVNRDGTGLHALPDAAFPASTIFDVAWSPDGSRIAFIDSGEAWSNLDGWHLAVVTVAPDGRQRSVLADAGSCFCLGAGPSGLTWSPDGTRLAVGRVGEGLYLFGPDGTDYGKVSDAWEYPDWRPVP